VRWCVAQAFTADFFLIHSFDTFSIMFHKK